MEVPERRRDAGRTRQRLLEAARALFAADGYASTTVRQVADDAGVDVALIKRYFGSKEGLFEACLVAAVHDLKELATPAADDDVALRLAHHALGTGVGGASSNQALILLLRSSGDAAIDELRGRVLLEHSRGLVRHLGARAQAVDEQVALLRAQVVMACVVGVAVLRASPGLEPLGSAGPDAIAGAFRDLLRG